MKKKVAVVVPIYTNKLKKTEQVSLRQLQRVLGRYPRIFVAPQSLELDLGELGEGFAVERFGDEWFTGVMSYSRLMLQPFFYERFRDYEYILVYQTDAFVFADHLLEFCKLGYDYIGSPVRGEGPWLLLGTMVGNGGFSLRRVAACQRAAGLLGALPDGHPLKEVFVPCEDSFFAYCGMRRDIDFRVAPLREALAFSVQDDVQHVYRRLKTGWRPFGCHAWDRYAPDIWNPIIEKAAGILLGPPRTKLMGKRHQRWMTRWQRHVKMLWQRRLAMPVWRLYGLIRRGEDSAALGMAAGWLSTCSEQNPIWSDMYQEFTYLYRLSLWHSSRWRDAAIVAPKDDEAVGMLLRQALLECIRRSLVSNGYTREKIQEAVLLLHVAKAQPENSSLYDALQLETAKAMQSSGIV